MTTQTSKRIKTIPVDRQTVEALEAGRVTSIAVALAEQPPAEHTVLFKNFGDEWCFNTPSVPCDPPVTLSGGQPLGGSGSWFSVRSWPGKYLRSPYGNVGERLRLRKGNAYFNGPRIQAVHIARLENGTGPWGWTYTLEKHP